jgi:hypothetical protein
MPGARVLQGASWGEIRGDHPALGSSLHGTPGHDNLKESAFSWPRKEFVNPHAHPND